MLLQAPVHQEPLETSRLLADWTYEPGGSESQLQQSEWVATLSLHGTGTAVENQAGSTASSAELQTRLANQTDLLQLSVRNGDGLWSEPDQSVFTTDFPLPAIVEAFPEWDPAAGAVSVGFGESEELRASYRWTGEPHASTSEMVQDGEVAATNLVTHPLGQQHSDCRRLGDVHDESRHVRARGDERPAVFFAESGFSGAVYVDPVDRPTPPVGTVVRWAVSIKVTVPVEQMRIRIVAYSGAEESTAAGRHGPSVPGGRLGPVRGRGDRHRRCPSTATCAR